VDEATEHDHVIGARWHGAALVGASLFCRAARRTCSDRWQPRTRRTPRTPEFGEALPIQICSRFRTAPFSSRAWRAGPLVRVDVLVREPLDPPMNRQALVADEQGPTRRKGLQVIGAVYVRSRTASSSRAPLTSRARRERHGLDRSHSHVALSASSIAQADKSLQVDRAFEHGAGLVGVGLRAKSSLRRRRCARPGRRRTRLAVWAEGGHMTDRQFHAHVTCQHPAALRRPADTPNRSRSAPECRP